MENKAPLVVDLDGTLIKADMLWEALIQAIQHRPLTIPKHLFTLMTQGRAAFKSQLSADFTLDPSVLPLRVEVLELINQAKLDGRKIVLSTGSDSLVAHKVASELNIFDEVIGSVLGRNNSGRIKAKDLVERYGSRGYDYIGDSIRDLPVWMAAKSRFTVKPIRSKREILDLRMLTDPNESGLGRQLLFLFQASRPHQWAKNLLIFVPAFVGQQILQEGVFQATLVAFISFSLVASSIYILNDVFDLQNDRSHLTKKFRPIASGIIPIPTALLFSMILLLFGVSLGLTLGPEPTAGLAIYFFLSLTYSVKMKKVVILDVATLAVLYSLRLVFGAIVASTEVSTWLLGFSFFLFFSLALVKRHSEATSVGSQKKWDSMPGRGYLSHDAGIIANLGVSAGLGSVIVFSLYLTSESVVGLYKTPEVLWLVVPILMSWVSWIWVRASRGEISEDPILFAMKDKFSMVCGLLAIVVFAIAQNILF
jgi:4-hydroxybenzoate polyprenyltransferase/phosphoserine phosphatase